MDGNAGRAASWVASWMARSMACALACAGCTDRNPWASPEQRINDAIPLSALASEGKAKLDESLKGDAAGRARVDAELATKLKVRALTCMEGHEPSFMDSAADIRAKLPAACFESFDNDLLAWMNARRLSLLLSAAPLRPIPSAPPPIVSTTNPINTVKFATEAGIAVVISNNTVEVIDIGSDESVFMDPALRSHPFAVAVSPNGRAFALGNSDGGGLVLRAAQTGEVLAEYPEYSRLEWLDSLAALLLRKDNRGIDLLDFASGKITPAKGLTGAYLRVLPVPDQKGQFVVGAYNTVTRFELRRDEAGVRIALLDQQNGPPMTWSDNVAETTSDGRYFVQASRDIWVTDLITLRSEQLPLPGLYFQSATPLPDPNEMLLRASMPVDASGQYFVVFSVKDRVFSPVEGDQLTGLPGYTAVRSVYIPAIKRVAIVSGKSIKLIDKLDRGFRYGPDAFAQRLKEVAEERQQKMAAETAQRMGYASSASFNGVPIIAGPVADVAKGAQVEAIGVYEPAGGGTVGAGVTAVHRRAPITVVVRRSTKPIVLVLASYEAVDWRLSVAAGAQLKAVLLAGHGDSTVNGAGAVRVVTIGKVHAYQLGSSGYAELQREVIRWTGKSIDTFQGKYTGATFLVGGI